MYGRAGYEEEPGSWASNNDSGGSDQMRSVQDLEGDFLFGPLSSVQTGARNQARMGIEIGLEEVGLCTDD